MLSAKDAVVIGMTHMKELLRNASSPMLEEVELSDDDQFWYITISVLVPGESIAPQA